MHEPVYPHPAGNLLRLLAVALLALVVTCVSGCTMQGAYVEADRLTYETVGKEYGAYVEEDDFLSPEQKARRVRKLESWKARIDRGSSSE